MIKELHDILHKEGIEHDEQPDCADFGGVVKKSFNPVGKTWLVEKSWTEGDHTFIEGWVSTPDPDLEKDVVEPESFQGTTFAGYYLRNAPLSSNHDTNGLPVGHLQKGVLVRDGVILQTEYHPTDPAEFTQFPGTGTGWYGRGVITEGKTGQAVQKGNIGAFSWIGNLREYESLPTGGKRYIKIDPLIESTVAAYPINPKAVMRVAKAYGLDDSNPQRVSASDPIKMKDNTLELEELLEKTAARMLAKQEEAAQAKKAQGVTIEQIGELLAQFGVGVDEKIKKALDAQKTEIEESLEPIRKAGTGRKGTIKGSEDADPREADPVAYITKKAQTKGGYDDLDQTDKAIIWGMTRKSLIAGMKDSEDAPDEISFIA